MIYRRHWVHSRFFAWKYDRTIFHGHALVRHYGTRPGFLLPQKTSLPDDSSMSKRKRTDAFQSVLPKYVSLEDLPDSVCYRDIELFYLKTLKANVTSFVPSSSFTISKVDQKALMGKGNFLHLKSLRADLILTNLASQQNSSWTAITN